MAPSFGVEAFLALGLELRDEVDESCSFSDATRAQGVLKNGYGASTTYEVMVTGTKGIHWRELSTQKVCRGFRDSPNSTTLGKRPRFHCELVLCSSLYSKAKDNTYLMNGPDSYTGMPKQQSSQTVGQEKASNDWTFFCDFPSITHIALHDANVSIFTQDNRCMVRLLALTFDAKFLS